jgi:hypothetical protein
LEEVKEQAVPSNHTQCMTGNIFSQNNEFVGLNMVREKFSGSYALRFLSFGLEIPSWNSGFLEFKKTGRAKE